jgi:hypothetical protein
VARSPAPVDDPAVVEEAQHWATTAPSSPCTEPGVAHTSAATVEEAARRGGHGPCPSASSPGHYSSRTYQVLQVN